MADVSLSVAPATIDRQTAELRPKRLSGQEGQVLGIRDFAHTRYAMEGARFDA